MAVLTLARASLEYVGISKKHWDNTVEHTLKDVVLSSKRCVFVSDFWRNSQTFC